MIALAINERWVRTCREELVNHIIPLQEDHLLRLLKEYVEYYNRDRRHMSLNKSPPIHRKRQSRKKGQVLVALPRVGGLREFLVFGWYKYQKDDLSYF